MDNSNNERTYIGLTIGPIVESISNAKETGELWASSYMFSYIMKNIINNLIKRDSSLKNRFIVPCVDNQEIFDKPQGVGLFHDRFIFQSNEGDFELVEDVIDEVKTNFINDVWKEFKKINGNEKNQYYSKAKEYINDFLKIYFVQADVEIEGQEENNNIIFKVNNCLDALELREKLSNEEEENYLFKVLKNSNLKKDHFLLKDAYGKKEREINYPSLFKIALAELDKRELPYDDDEIKNYIIGKSLEEYLIKAHEYVAIIQADGDFMGKVISGFKINNNEENIYKNYKEFSKKLLEYSKESYEIIKRYGGFTVYAGGDDLLFIAPIVNKYGEVKSNNEMKNSNGEVIEESFDRNIFGLIDCLSKVFENKFKNYEKDGEKVEPTTSFGVAVVHHKFPLYYALDEARELLFSKAKNYKNEKKDKNAIAFKVIKNSGQSFETVVGKGSESYKEFKSLFKNVVGDRSRDKKTKNYLKAIHFRLLKDKIILNKIGKDKKLLENYFNNNFNEEIHKTEPIKSYIKKLITFINKIYCDIENEEEEICIDQIYSYLRFIKFMDEDIRLEDWKVDRKEG